MVQVIEMYLHEKKQGHAYPTGTRPRLLMTWLIWNIPISPTWGLTYFGLAVLYGNRGVGEMGSVNGLLPDGTKPLPEPKVSRVLHHSFKCINMRYDHENKHYNAFENYAF